MLFMHKHYESPTSSKEVVAAGDCVFDVCDTRFMMFYVGLGHLIFQKASAKEKRCTSHRVNFLRFLLPLCALPTTLRMRGVSPSACPVHPLEC